MSWNSLLETLGLGKLNIAVMLSILLVLMMSVTPMPLAIDIFRPQWVLLAVLYWCIALPKCYNIGFAWLCGLAMDLLHNNVIGLHALSYVVVVTFAMLLHQHFRLYPLWQQALLIGILLLPHFLLSLWIHNSLYTVESDWRYWAQLPVSMLLWPWVFSVLRFIRHKVS